MKQYIKKFIDYNFFANVRIIRENSHKNDIRVLYIPKKKIFRKLSNKKYGKTNLKNEYNGLVWYLKRKKKNHKNFVKKNKKIKNFLCLDIKKIEGYKLNYEKPISSNYKILRKFIRHYVKIWPQKKVVPCHGDMTLDNIIFQKNNFFVIDWEHFKNSGEKRGFDLAYLILSAVSLPYLKHRTFLDKDKKVFLKLWNVITFLKLDNQMTYKPFYFFKKIFNEKKHWIRISKKSPKKLFINNLDNKFISQIHSIIN